MIQIILYALKAVCSIIPMALIGVYMRHTGAVDEKLAEKLNGLAFRYFLSVQLFLNVYSVEDLGSISMSVLFFFSLLLVLEFFIGMATVGFMTDTNKKKGALVQSFFRSNTAVLGIPLANMLAGESAVILMSVLLAPFSIICNVQAIIALTILSDRKDQEKMTVCGMLKKILKNPIIIAILCALACQYIRRIEPLGSNGQPLFTLKNNLSPIYDTIVSLSKVASPVMLLMLGARMKISSVSRMKREIRWGVAVRTVLMPTMGFALLYICSNVLYLFPAGPEVYAAGIGLLATPCAVSAAAMCDQMDSDGELAGQLVVWSSLVYVLTAFVLVVILRTIGLL